MGQILSKCFSSTDVSNSSGKDITLNNATNAHHPTSAPPAGTVISSNPVAITSPPVAVVPPNQASTTPNQVNSPPAPRDFWKEAVQKLPKEYKLPEELKADVIDQDSVVEMANIRMKECKDKQWKITINGEERTVRELFERAVGWLRAFALVGDTAIQYDPVHAALPWAGFRFLLQVATNDIETYSAMVAGLERATWLTSYCSAQERLYKEYFSNNPKYSDLNNAFVENLVQLYVAVLKFFIQAYQYFGTKTAARFAKSIMQPSAWVTELTETIGDRKARMEDYASLVHKSNVHRDLKDVLGTLEPFLEYMDEGRKMRQEKEREDFMSWLSGIKYTEDHQDHRSTVLKNPNKSGQWMLGTDEFRIWKEQGGLLWLHGIPGAGKSKLTSIAIDHLMSSDESHTVAYFYCLKDTAQSEKGDPREIFRAILKQLVIRLPKYLSAPVKKRYEERRERQKDHGSIERLTLRECADFIEQFATNRPVTIVIDALDECHESTHRLEGRKELISQLKSMINPPSKIKIFLSSRRGYHDIDYQLRDYPVIPMDDPRNAEDIPYFIESEVKELVEEKASLWGSSKSLEADIIGALKEKAGGMFRWVVLQIDHLRDSATPGAVRQRLKQLPATLYALHDEIYERISKMAQSDLDTAEAVLSWLLCAQRRLDYEEFLAAALTNPDEPVTTKQILQICRNLVVQGASGSFDFAHLSVREYLETRPEYKDRQPDVLVAKKCLGLLESSTLEDTLGPYASIYWLQHCSGPIMEKRLAGVVERLFSDKGENEMFRTWSIIANRAADALDWDSEARRRLRDTGYNPLSVACVFGFPKVLTQWVNTQPPEYSYLRETDDMVVHLAIKWGNVDVVRLLLQKNGQSAFDNFGLTPAFWAAFFGHQPVLEVLKQLDGCLDAEDDMGWTAWNWMIAIDHMEGLRDLLKVNTGVSMTDQIGWTILHWAAFLGREDQARQLIAAQHKLDAKDNEKRMPFELAAFMRYEETAALLRIGEPSIGSTLGYNGTSLEVMIS